MARHDRDDVSRPYDDAPYRRDEGEEAGDPGDVEETDPSSTSAVFGLPAFPPGEDYEPTRTSRRRQLVRAAGVFVPAFIAVVSLAVVLGGRPTTSAGGTPDEAASRQTSAGNVALSPERPRSRANPETSLPQPVIVSDSAPPLDAAPVSADSVRAIEPPPTRRDVAPPPTRRPRVPVNRAPTFRVEPRPPASEQPTPGATATARPLPRDTDTAALPTDAARTDAARTDAGRARGDASARDDSAARATPGGAGIAGSAVGLTRCDLPTSADQRACLLAHIDRGDERLGRVYQTLISELRRVAGTDAADPDPPAVRRLRIEQRAWLSVRDVECRRQATGAEGALWARERAPCFAEMSASRATELQEAVNRLRSRR